MRQMASLCLLLLPLAQGTIVSMTATSEDHPPYELDLVDPLTGQFKKIVDISPDGTPYSGVLRNDNTFIYSNVFPNLDSRLTTVDLSTGKVQEGQLYPFFFSNIGFDKVTNQTFVVAQNQTTARYPLFELLPDQTLRTFMELPDQTGDMGAYSSSKHIFFLGAPSPDQSNIVAVSTMGTGKLLYNVSVDLWLNSLVYDDTFGVLYGWGLNLVTVQTNLVSLDFTTGTILKTFIKSTFYGGPACINTEGTMIYSSCFLSAGSDSVIHSLNVSTGKASLAPAPSGRHAMIMTCQ